MERVSCLGPAHNARFDHHQSDADGKPQIQSRKVLYCARQGITRIAVVFQGTRAVNRAYLSPMDSGVPAIALNERAEDAMPDTPLSNRPLNDPLLTDVIDALTHRLGYLKR